MSGYRIAVHRTGHRTAWVALGKSGEPEHWPSKDGAYEALATFTAYARDHHPDLGFTVVGEGLTGQYALPVAAPSDEALLNWLRS